MTEGFDTEGRVGGFDAQGHEEDLVVFVMNDSGEFAAKGFETEFIERAFEDGVLNARAKGLTHFGDFS